MPINGPFSFSQPFHDGIDNGIANVNNVTYHLENYPPEFKRRIIDLLHRAGVAPNNPSAPNNPRARAMDEDHPPPYPDEEPFPEEDPQSPQVPPADDPPPAPSAGPEAWTPIAADLLAVPPFSKPAIEYLHLHATHQELEARRKRIMRTLAMVRCCITGESLEVGCEQAVGYVAERYAANPENFLRDTCRRIVQKWNQLLMMGMAMMGGGMGGGFGGMGCGLGGGGLGAGTIGNYMLIGPGMGGGFGGSMGAATGGGMWPSGGFGAGPI